MRILLVGRNGFLWEQGYCMSSSNEDNGGGESSLQSHDLNLTDDFFIGADASENILEVGLNLAHSYADEQKSKDTAKNNLSVREFGQRYSINEGYIKAGVVEGLDFHIKRSL